MVVKKSGRDIVHNVCIHHENFEEEYKAQQQQQTLTTAKTQFTTSLSSTHSPLKT